MDLKKELRDQFAHFAAGLIATLILAMLISVWLSALAVIAFAVGREIYQRVSTGRPWYQCYSGCMLDLLFWVLGIGLAVGLTVFL